MTAHWRVDHVETGALRNAETRWFETEAEAVAEETRLHLAGVARAVAWECGEGSA